MSSEQQAASKVSVSGSCLCRAVTYDIAGPLRPVCLCHCEQCRKTSGHYVAATQTRVDAITIHGNSLTWFASSESASRGFCSICGSNLFWKPVDGDFISIFAGTIDGETGLETDSQLFAESKGDYYALPDVTVVAQSTLKR